MRCVLHGDLPGKSVSQGRILTSHGERGNTPHFCQSISFEGRLVTYDVGELDEVALAYAATVHKSQGSEYPVVVIPLATQHYPMLARNLLYTGVTRGKQLVVVIGQPRALAIAVRNVRATQRLTNLAARLQDVK
jgi:exodeoxyribonuclease V alpha subunit